MTKNEKQPLEILFSAYCEGENLTTSLDADREETLVKLGNLLDEKYQDMLQNVNYTALKAGFYAGFYAAKDLLLK